jgi:hypothetical protein
MVIITLSGAWQLGFAVLAAVFIGTLPWALMLRAVIRRQRRPVIYGERHDDTYRPAPALRTGPAAPADFSSWYRRDPDHRDSNGAGDGGDSRGSPGDATESLPWSPGIATGPSRVLADRDGDATRVYGRDGLGYGQHEQAEYPATGSVRLVGSPTPDA